MCSFKNKNLLKFKIDNINYKSNDSLSYSAFNELSNNYSKSRRVNKNPIKVLDAPALSDDFYLNLIDWSS